MRYFAYGANMNPATITQRCPGARGVGGGVLFGYRFLINESGVATVVPDKKQAVFGVVWEIVIEDEAALDIFEGVENDFYYKAAASITLAGGEEMSCLIYVARNSNPGSPRSGYLDDIVKTAEKLKFPDEYINDLKLWL